jgi:hypothetical protein
VIADCGFRIADCGFSDLKGVVGTGELNSSALSPKYLNRKIKRSELASKSLAPLWPGPGNHTDFSPPQGYPGPGKRARGVAPRVKPGLVSAGSLAIMMIVPNVAAPIAKISTKIAPVMLDIGRVGANLSPIRSQLLS